MPGLFSRVGTYMPGLANSAKQIALGGMGRTAAGALYGGLSGAAYGMASSDTSVIGGALGGAAIGAAGARYLGAGFLSASRAGRGMGFKQHSIAYGKAFSQGVENMARRDARRARVFGTSARIQANRGFGKIRGLFN